jgi:hypothetical protein
LGKHSFVIYDSLDAFREFYCHYAKEMLNGNRNVLIFPYFETTSSVSDYLKEYGVSAIKYKNDNSLIILDAYEKFFASIKEFVHYLPDAARYARDKNKSGITAIVDITALDHHCCYPLPSDSRQRLINYENEVKVILNSFSATENDGPNADQSYIELVCCYHRANYKKMLVQNGNYGCDYDPELQEIFKAHTCCIEINNRERYLNNKMKN